MEAGQCRLARGAKLALGELRKRAWWPSRVGFNVGGDRGKVRRVAVQYGLLQLDEGIDLSGRQPALRECRTELRKRR